MCSKYPKVKKNLGVKAKILFLCVDFSQTKDYNDINNVVDIVVNKERIKMFDVNELLEEAVKETENLTDGEVFLVKDLFKGYVWNRIPRKDRLLLGTLFLNRVKTNSYLKPIEKTSSKQQKYEK